MANQGASTLESFHRFVGEQLRSDAAAQMSPEQALALWRERQEAVQAIREVLDDVEAGRTKSPEALQLLQRLPWPGKVRELQNVLRPAISNASGGMLVPEFQPAPIRHEGNDAPAKWHEEGGELAALEQTIYDALRDRATGLYNAVMNRMEKYLLSRVLGHTGGNQSEAARILGITRSSLRNKTRTAQLAITREVLIDNVTEGSEP